MKRRSYLSSRESRSFFAPRLEKRERVRTQSLVEKFISNRSILLSKNWKFVGRKWPRRQKSVAFVGLDREYRRDTLEISRRIRIIRRRVKQEGDERIVRLVSEIQSMPDRMSLTCWDLSLREREREGGEREKVEFFEDLARETSSFK